MTNLTAVLACVALIAAPCAAHEQERETSEKPFPSWSTGRSLGGAGIGQGQADGKPGAGARRDEESASGGGSGPAARGAKRGGKKDAAEEPAEEPAAEDSIRVMNIGDLPTIGDLIPGGSGPGRPVVHLIGGKWAIRLQHKGPGRGIFPMLLGGTNGDITGNGKYKYKAAFATKPGIVSGPEAKCVTQMHNAAYTTCEQPCSMKWELRFGTPPKERIWKDLCELENNQIYYLNIEPVLAGCTGSPAHDHGCPLVMEVANGGVQLMNP